MSIVGPLNSADEIFAPYRRPPNEQTATDSKAGTSLSPCHQKLIVNINGYVMRYLPYGVATAA